MIWLLIFLSLLVFVLCYLLFAPFYIEINSYSGLCRVRFHKLITARLRIIKSSLILDLKIAWWQKQIDLLASRKQKAKLTERRNRNIAPGKMTAILKSFKINKLYLTLCFDNMPLNGILYPLFRWLSIKTGKSMEINFWYENEVVLEIENNFFRIIRAYIKS